MSTENIIKVVAYSKNWRDVAHDNAMQFEEELADLEGKRCSTDGECVILNHKASKLQVYGGDFHKYHRLRGWRSGPGGTTEDFSWSWPHDDGFVQADDKLMISEERL